MKTENRLVTMEISHLDDFKLEVEQQLYELDENDEDISYEGWLYLRYQKIRHERHMETATDADLFIKENRCITWCIEGDC